RRPARRAVTPRHHARPSSRRALILAVALVAVVLHPLASGAQPSDTEKEREEVRKKRADVEAQIDTLEAEDAEVRAALEELNANVDAQRGRVEEAERAAAEAAAEVVEAEKAVAAAERRIDELNVAADELVVEAYVNPPSGSALDALNAESMSDATIKKSLL